MGRVTKEFRELKALFAGVHSAFRIKRDARHIVFTIEGPKGSETVICSKSPSDRRNIKNTRACAIRACIAAGLTPELKE